MIRRALVFLMLLACAVGVDAQTSDLARVEYTYFPQSNSENSFRRFRTLFNAPIRLKKDGSFLVIGAEYRNVDLKYQDNAPFVTDDLERFQSYNLSLGYTFKISDVWRFGVRAGTIAASNFEDGVKSDDFLVQASLYFIKDIDREDQPGTKKNKRLILGLRYSTTAGRPFPLPVINYNVRTSENWSYTLGVPKTNLKYFFNEKNILQSFITLDGFYANIQDPRTFLDSNLEQKTIDNISNTVVLAGLGYEYYFTDHLLLYLYGGHTLINNLRLENEDMEEVYIINDTNSFYMRGGVKFKI